MPAPIEFQLHEKENALYVCLKGDLDEHSFLTVSRVLEDCELDHPVEVDLGNVKYADSTGLRALVLLQRQAEQAGVEFIILKPSEAVKRVFRTTGFGGIFQVRESDPDSPC